MNDSNEYDNNNETAISAGGGGERRLLPCLHHPIRTQWDTRFWMSRATSSKLGKWTSSSSLISLLDVLLADIIFGDSSSGGGGGGSNGGGECDVLCADVAKANSESDEAYLGGP